MAASAQEVLAQIPDLVRSRDASTLVGFAEHGDKVVRKAVRKAIHVLKTKGVEIPEKGNSWTPGSVAELRGGLEEAAMADVGTTPGLMRLFIAKPGDDSNGYLFVANLTAFDQVVAFKAYVQTDGQRSRLLRDWQRQADGRSVPAEWARARVRWAREQTLSLGVEVPQELNQALIHLGDAPSERPAAFMGESLAAYEGELMEVIDGVLRSVAANVWPPVMEVEPFLKRVTEAHPDITQETPEDERQAALIEGIAGDPQVRKALAGPLANLLEDSGIGLWLTGKDELAGHAIALAKALRDADEPETLPWVGRIVGLQIASTMAYQNQRQQQQMRARG